MIRILSAVLLAAQAWGAAPTMEGGSGGGYVARQPQHGLEARFGSDRTVFRHREKRFTMSLQGHAASGAAAVEENRIELPHGDVTEWFINGEEGLEHGFTVARDFSKAPLTLAIEVSGDYVPVLESGEVVLVAADGARLRYGGLKSWDATGRSLASRAEVDGRLIRLHVDDAAAQYPVTVDPLFQESPITASDPSSGAQFGYSMAADGDTLVVGAPFADGLRGVVYVYVKSGASWQLQQRLVPVPSGNSVLAGLSVAISGDTLAIGIPQIDFGRGAVAIYTRSGATWTLQQTLTRPVAGYFGYSVALQAETLVVGSPNERVGLDARGGVRMYLRTNGTFNQQGEFIGTTGEHLGFSVAIDGDTAAVGRAAGAEIYVRSGTVWSQQAVLTAPGTDSPVAVSGDTVMVGNTSWNAARGAVHVYFRDNGTWPLQTTITASEGTANARFGHSIVLRGDSVLIGAYGASQNVYANVQAFLQPTVDTSASYLYVRTAPTSWAQTKLNLAIPTTQDNYGFAVALSGSSALVGAPYGNNNNGHVIPFRFENVQLNTTPGGRTFSLTGTGCNGQGTFTTPYSGFWSSCSVQWTANQETADTKTTFLGWGDGSPLNPRTFVLSPSPVADTLKPTTVFRTDYMLTTTALPESGGVLSGAGWYQSGSQAPVSAFANAGFVFAGFGGAASGVIMPQTVTMDGPKTVTGAFAATPPAILSGLVSAKAGSAGTRSWVFSLRNNGPGMAYDAQVYFIQFVQTFGTACTTLPVRRSPV
ncbi:MAG: FG-GAP repeat protein, partial [Bryobacterales bacterium]|nr:FG-GAP repeat protein [Bryobacterales bacterium]